VLISLLLYVLIADLVWGRRILYLLHIHIILINTILAAFWDLAAFSDPIDLTHPAVAIAGRVVVVGSFFSVLALTVARVVFRTVLWTLPGLGFLFPRNPPRSPKQAKGRPTLRWVRYHKDQHA
jgi:hypothetical protein